MKIICANLPSNKPSCIAAIGVFDGVHLGHRLILEKIKKQARKDGVSSLLITFDTPPQIVLKKHFPGALSDSEDKEQTVRSLGIDYLWFLKTHSRFLKFSGKEFIIYILKHFHIRQFIVGDDFRFGYKGACDIDSLLKIGREYNFSVKVIKKKAKHNEIISSTLIRELIKKGKVQEAAKFLGRPYFLKGKVVKGRGFGQKLGFPTANLKVADYIIPGQGVYAGLAEISGKTYACALNIGLRPTVAKTKKELVEAYLIDFNKDILGKEIKVFFAEKLRNEQKFADVEQLRAAIARDVDKISLQKERTELLTIKGK